MRTLHCGPSRGALVLAALLAAAARPAAADCSLGSTGLVPLPDLGTSLYHGFAGGLYGGGADARPPAHLAAALGRAAQIQPLDAAGNPDPVAGKIAMLSVGMSNTNFEFSRFVAVAGADPARNPKLVIVNAAQGGKAADSWISPSAPTWATADQLLAQAGVTPRQVQVAWVKQALAHPAGLGAFPLHAQTLQSDLEQIARNLLARYPNLRLAYFSSRTRAYTGDPSTLNPEPFAYESGFSVQWMIAKQIAGDASLNFDPARGAVTAPLLLWGPYLWADGLVPRSDGFTWACQDTQADFTHPSPSGTQKVASELLAYFSTDPTAAPWFLRPGGAGGALAVTAGASPARGAPPLTVTFSAQTSGAVAQLLWTFDDGTFSPANAPTKIYHAPGSYTARVTVADGAGNTALASAAVTVGTGSAPSPCVASPTVLCLLGGRFQVAATWQTGSGTSGAAQAVPLTGDTGSFWFFDPSNVELLVKVLDGCPASNSFWVFAGGLTNVGVVLRVTDSQTGMVRTYDNPQGTAFLPLQDTAAFATCP
ncbi:MAG TPA: PKD domain-containing protein [Thermoanaerobaculia bacterium]|nr:PKD domain-containing protein [Thermoanaerobaculia bacterium]